MVEIHCEISIAFISINDVLKICKKYVSQPNVFEKK